MKKYLVALASACLLAACSGIPLSSLPQLLRLQDALIDLDPAEVMLAVQVDKDMVPPLDAAPMLVLAIHPAESGAFEPIDEKLPMQFSVSATDTLGLSAPPEHRRWLVYSLTPESQAEVLRIQNYFKHLKRKGGGGSLGMGIEQAGIASGDPALADTWWESWLQISAREGFFELWSGRLADLRERAEDQ